MNHTLKMENYEDSPLMQAIYINAPDKIQQSLMGGDINYQNKLGLTALHYACMFSDLQTVAKLCSIGCNPIIKDNKGNTPMHYASKYSNNINIINILIEYGASVNITNYKNVTPLMKGCDHNPNEGVIGYIIIMTNINYINKQNKYGNTALHFLYYRNKFSLIPQIINAGANIRIANNLNKSYLSLTQNFYNPY